MQVVVQISDLKKALNLVKPAVAARVQALPVLSGARVEASPGKLTVTGTDLDLTITATVPARVERSGAAVVPHRLLADLLHGGDDVHLELDDTGDIVATNGSVSRLRPLPLDEWPRIIDAGMFSTAYQVDIDAIRRVLPAASAEDSRPILTGVHFDGDEDLAVATDSYRLHISTLRWPMPKMLIPSRVLAAVVGAATPRMRKGKRPPNPKVMMLVPNEANARLGVQFRIEGAELAYTTRLIDGVYPNFRAMLGTDYPNRSVFDRDVLLAAVKQVATFVRDTTTPVHVTLSPDAQEAQLEVTGHMMAGSVAASVPVVHHGNPITVAFNPRYLSDLLAVAGPKVALETVDAMKVATLRTVEDDGDSSDGYSGLLMPVRIPQERTSG